MDSTPFATLHEGMEGVLAHIIQSFMNAMKQHGLSTPQIHALMYIFHAGECQVSDIGDLTDVSNAAASQLVERLVQQGLVDRREDPKDRRNKLVTLSEKGKELFHESVMSNQLPDGNYGGPYPETAPGGSRCIHASCPRRPANIYCW